MPFTDTEFQNLSDHVSSINRKMDALVAALKTLAEAVVEQIKSDTVVKEKMSIYFSEEIRLLGLEDDERKTQGTEADGKY